MGWTQVVCGKKDPKAVSHVEADGGQDRSPVTCPGSLLSFTTQRLHTHADPILVSPRDMELVVLLCFAAQKHHGSKAQSILLVVRKTKPTQTQADVFVPHHPLPRGSHALGDGDVFNHKVFLQIHVASNTRIIPKVVLLADRSPTFFSAPVDFGVKQDQAPSTTHEQPASRKVGEPETCMLLPAPPHCAILCKTLLIPPFPFLQ